MPHTLPHRRRLLAGLGLLPAALACRAARADGRVELRVGDQKGGLRSILEAAGALRDLPFDIRWYEFPAAAPLLEALNAGAIEVGVAGDAPLIFAQASGAKLRAFSARRTDPVGVAVVAKAGSPLTDAASLKGRSIATGRGSIGHFIALAALRQAGLRFDDVTFRFMLPSDAKLALHAGSVDAWSTWDPYTALAETVDHAKVIVTGRGLSSGLTYLIGTEPALRDKPAALAELARRVRTATGWAVAHPDEYSAVFAQALGIPLDAARLTFTRSRPQWAAIDPTVIAEQQRTADLYLDAGLIGARLDAAAGFARLGTA
ncbi:ABC transporter substrate-binding protein [Derxia gummosa]|uniref:Putative aliphatic sulfonates-binding protein n=1 Tax=Derxia gummosa DSM 723 TaxID=1121388 RepID=A0A8B6X4L6_9BURK|nr:ABC transporter substrate-binding protein [Derxia gummosa]